jgi:hypothetical protein
VIAPCKVHHLFVADHLAAYPTARFFAPPGLAEKRRDLRLDGVLGDEAPAEWRGQIDQHLFRGAPYINEVVFLHRASRTLVLTDLAFNVPAGGGREARVFYFLVGAVGKFGPHRLVRTLIRDRRAARESVERILSWDFDRVIVSHGEVLASGGRERFRDGFAFLRS